MSAFIFQTTNELKRAVARARLHYPMEELAIVSMEELDFLRECRDMVEVGIQQVKPNGLARWFRSFKEDYGSVFRVEKLDE